MFCNFTEEARKILVNAKQEMYELKHPYVGSEHLLLSILKDKNSVSKKLNIYKLTYDALKQNIIETIGTGKKESEWFLYTPLLKRIIESAIIDSKENNNGEVTIEHLFSALLEEGEGVAIRIMLGLGIDIDNLYGDFSYKIGTIKRKKNKKLLLEELGVDLTKKAINGELDPVIGRDNEIKRILEILSRRTKNNPLLIGDAGVGKTAIVEELSRLIINGEVPNTLKNKRIISLDMATTVAGTKYRGEFEERVRKILKEIEENDDLILFIDEVHTLVGAGGAEGAIDASNIFKPALARNKIKCIGATTTLEYKKHIEEDKALERRFQKVVIEAPNKEIVKDILSKLKPIYEQFHNVKINEKLLGSIIDLSDKYIYERNQPDKAIDILDEVCAKASFKENKELSEYNKLVSELSQIISNKNEAIIENNFKQASLYKSKEFSLMDKINNLEFELCKSNVKEVDINDVANVVHSKTKIPIYEILNENDTLINNIKKDLTKKIIGQDSAINQILNIAKKIKLGFKDDNSPNSCLFCGSTGVGKTELAKIFGENLVGKRNVIKLDMSEYSEAHSISKIIGAPPGYVGYSDKHHLLEEIRNKPFSLIILDEIEKAHYSIINLLFQILEEGKIKDSKGIEARFDNVVIIMTSNIGFNNVNVGFNKLTTENVTNKLKEQFSVQFINRIDNIIIFNKLKEEDINIIIDNKIDRLKAKYAKRKVTIKIDEKVRNSLLKMSEYEEYGARRIDKLIKESIENEIIEKIVQNKKTITVKNIKEKVKL